MTTAKRREAEEIARLNEAMTQVLAKTEEYKKELLVKRKQLEEINAANASPADQSPSANGHKERGASWKS